MNVGSLVVYDMKMAGKIDIKYIRTGTGREPHVSSPTIF